jgi:hypothetical protein
MLKAERWNNSVSRVELDHRARAARLRLERNAELLIPVTAARASWLRRLLFRRFGVASAVMRRRPGHPGAEPGGTATPIRPTAIRRLGWLEIAVCEVDSALAGPAKIAGRDDDRSGCAELDRSVMPPQAPVRFRRFAPHRPQPLPLATCRSAAMFECVRHGPRESALWLAARCRLQSDWPRRRSLV